MASPPSSTTPPAPSGQVLSLISALSNTENHDLHVQAIRARDEALSTSPETYGNLCLQLAYTLVGCDRPEQMINGIDPADIEAWRQTDTTSVLRLQQDETLWVPFGQMAGLILKNALLRPPILADARSLSLQTPASDLAKETLLFGLSCRHAELRAVVSSVIATSAVSADSVQPALYVRAWPQLIPTLMNNMQQYQQQQQQQGDQSQQQSQPPPENQLMNADLVEGSLSTVRKIMEDGPAELDQEELDHLIPLLIAFFSAPDDRFKVSAMQAIAACLANKLMPSALVLHFNEYLGGLSALATDPNPNVRKWVCRSIVTLLEMRTEYVQPHMESVCQFMLQSTAELSSEMVALEACEFWLTFANLDSSLCSPDMFDTVVAILPQLIPVLLQSMIYSQEQQQEHLYRNEMEMQENGNATKDMRPIFHKSRLKSNAAAGNPNASNSEDNDDDDDDDDDFDDDDGNEWTLRKCAAASLDSLSNLFGAEPILPVLLLCLQEGLANADPWVQEASILGLGAIAEGCRDEMSVHMSQLHPYLMSHLAAPETPQNLPQLKSIAAWTLGRYAQWAVQQVQTGAQGQLLATMTQVFIARLNDKNRRVQVAVCSAFGTVMETAGDLMAPYLQPIYEAIVGALSRYQGRSLLMLFDVLGIMADYCGPAIAEGHLPAIYVPSMLLMWDGLAKNDPTDRTLLPLMESLASIAMTSGMNFQPYALQSFDNAMGIIEASTLMWATQGADRVPNEEDADPIVCATDLLDGLVEGLGSNFALLVTASRRYGQVFLQALHALCQHDVPGVRMSALALLGDIARHAPTILQPGLNELLQEAIANIDPVQPQVCTNAVWAVGEICVQCEGHKEPLEPVAAVLLQSLMGLLVGNGVDGAGGTDIPGLAENAAACVGRLAKASPDFVAPELPRFLVGWCQGMQKIQDPTERRDAYVGFTQALYANPQAIQQVTNGNGVADAILAILGAICTWHVPDPTVPLAPDTAFGPFPQAEAAELGAALAQLVKDVKASVSEEVWQAVENQLPVNARQLLRETYQL